MALQQKPQPQVKVTAINMSNLSAILYPMDSDSRSMISNDNASPSTSKCESSPNI